ncbi:hypothetical protein CAEBREN_03208 [Caenorhabditis brenneri]|uniref:Uncharacterized protein n=1 Tax=Caenorhabditis brenneri TaxID=135651 RepID=G0PEJ8_CAEBE|nr:hypothetical protein CAEBREN_03208 [Caenorhabditis brenneri]
MFVLIFPLVSIRRVPIGPINPNRDLRPLWFFWLGIILIILAGLALFLPFWMVSTFNDDTFGIVPYSTTRFQNQTWASVASISMYVGFSMSLISIVIAFLLAQICSADVQVSNHRRWYLITSAVFFISFIVLFVPYILFATQTSYFSSIQGEFAAGSCPKMSLAAACFYLFESMLCLLIRLKFCKDPGYYPETMPDTRNI